MVRVLKTAAHREHASSVEPPPWLSTPLLPPPPDARGVGHAASAARALEAELMRGLGAALMAG